MRPLPRLLMMALALAMAAPASAQPTDAQPTDSRQLVVGVYAPRLRFANSLARNRLAEQVAAGLTAGLGQPVKGRGFATRGEFESQVRAGAVHFAVVDAQSHVEHPKWSPLAQSTRGGKKAAPMVLVASGGARGIADLSGKSLAEVPVGPKDAWFRVHFLLQGQVTAGYFGKGRKARDAQGALSLLKLGKADGAFVYQSDAEGGRAILTTRPVPLPVAVVTAELDAGVVQRARAALTSLQLSGAPIDGFTSYGPSSIAPLRRALGGALSRRQSESPVMAKPGDLQPSTPAFPAALGDLPVEAANPAAGLIAPKPPADLF